MQISNAYRSAQIAVAANRPAAAASSPDRLELEDGTDIFMRFVDDLSKMEVTRTAELTPAQTIQTVRDIYQQLGPEIGCRFVESPILLLLAGKRGMDGWNAPIAEPKLEHVEKFRKLNRMLGPRGIAILPSPAFPDTGKFTLVNLSGLERCTRESRLPGVVPFQFGRGWRGFFEHYLPRVEASADVHANTGVQLGYPDLAIQDAVMGPVLFPRDRLVYTRLKEADRYDAALPDYGLDKDHVDCPEILAHVKSWESFFRACYDDPNHRRLAAIPVFVKARNAVIGDNSYSRERALRGEISRPSMRIDPNTDMAYESLLRQRGPEIAAAVTGGARPEVISSLVGSNDSRVLMDEYVLVQWTRRGLLEPDGPAGPVAKAMLAAQRPLLELMGRGDLSIALQPPPNHYSPEQVREAVHDNLRSPFIDLLALEPADRERMATVRHLSPTIRKRVDELLTKP